MYAPRECEKSHYPNHEALWAAQGKPSSRSENGEESRERRLTWLLWRPFLHRKREGMKFHGLNLLEQKMLHSRFLINLPGFGAEGKEEASRLYQPSKNGDRLYFSRRWEMCTFLILWRQGLYLSSNYDTDLIFIILNTWLSILKNRNSPYYSR